MDSRLLQQYSEGHWSSSQPLRLERRHGFLLASPGDDFWALDAIGVRPDARGRGIGSALLSEALAHTGRQLVWDGGGLRHFFPGLPHSLRGHLGFFSRFGFQLDGRYVDLEIDLRNRPPGPYLCDATPQELLAFLEGEFPGRWLADTRFRLEQEANPEDVTVLRRHGRVVAFCHTWSDSNRWLGPSVYWIRHQQSRWAGIGPLGVARAYRGQGLGRLLVEQALNCVADRGARTVIVDFTDLISFYEDSGFRVWQTYHRLKRPGGVEGEEEGCRNGNSHSRPGGDRQ